MMASIVLAYFHKAIKSKQNWVKSRKSIKPLELIKSIKSVKLIRLIGLIRLIELNQVSKKFTTCTLS